MADERPVLVTGFGPFRGHPINASWVAVQELKQKLAIEHNGKEVQLEVREIPVVYDFVQSEIPKLWEEVKPRFCVHVGVAGRTNVIRIEKYGRNVGYHSMDIQKKVPIENVCVLNGPNEICTRFNTDLLCKKASERMKDVDFVVSSDAGRYLCDYIYYTSLHLNQGPVLFIHVPDLDHPYSSGELAMALKHILECLLEEID